MRDRNKAVKNKNCLKERVCTKKMRRCLNFPPLCVFLVSVVKCAKTLVKMATEMKFYKFDKFLITKGNYVNDNMKDKTRGFEFKSFELKPVKFSPK